MAAVDVGSFGDWSDAVKILLSLVSNCCIGSAPFLTLLKRLSKAGVDSKFLILQSFSLPACLFSAFSCPNFGVALTHSTLARYRQCLESCCSYVDLILAEEPATGFQIDSFDPSIAIFETIFVVEGYPVEASCPNDFHVFDCSPTSGLFEVHYVQVVLWNYVFLLIYREVST